MEINEIEETILTSFFELDRKSLLNVHLFDSSCHILKEKNILNFKLLCEFDRIEKLETHNNSYYIVMMVKIFSLNLSKAKNWNRDFQLLDLSSIPDEGALLEAEIVLVELKSLFLDIVELNTQIGRFYDLNRSLNSIIKFIDSLLKNLKLDSLQCSRSKDSSGYKAISERISMNSITSKNNKTNVNVNSLIDELIIQLNGLFQIPKLYILYSEQFRNIFQIHLLFDKKKSDLNGTSILDFEKSENIISSSSNSILENLLN